MLAKRIIPCLDVKDGVVVKGTKFRDHKIVGDIVELARRYSNAGADELVFYDITASSDGRTVNYEWVSRVACEIDIPFCVAGGIRSVDAARRILQSGADKISINSPALERPELISELATAFGNQCVVIGIDSYQQDNDYYVYQYTGDPNKIRATQRQTLAWAAEVQALGAGEIVLNCMNQDGVKKGYDIVQLKKIREILTIPLIASGGAGHEEHFLTAFSNARVDGALAASVFHSGTITIPALKHFLKQHKVEIRS